LSITLAGRSIVLAGGDYLIGRAPSCTVVLDERSVSRQHARLRIGAHGASIEDLGSTNGVFVNGKRVAEPEALEDGDIVIVGEEQLEIRLTLPAVDPDSRETLPDAPSWSAPDLPSATLSPASTERIDAFKVLAGVAERALAENRPLEAERILQPRLLEILTEAYRSPASSSAGAVDRALTLSVALAEAVPSRRWLDYAIDLLTALSKPCTDRMASDLRRARTRVGGIDDDRLDAYSSAIRKLTSSMDTLRTLAIVDELRG
jgi:pSer/pThr/pTyr-binding forkhead associated (FHA) protein